MAKRFAPITPGEILAAEFMLPLGINQAELARAIDVSPRRVNRLVHGHHRLSADLALRLGTFFGTTPELWLRLQMTYDLRIARRSTWRGVQQRVRTLSGGSVTSANSMNPKG